MMSTIGKQWREVQQRSRDDDDRASLERTRAEERAEAEADIRRIPGLIAKAKGESDVRVYGWVAFTDVAGTHKDKVDQLYDKLHKEDRPLRASDLTGRAAIVFAWCDANDLECFLVSVDIPMNEDEYDFHIRPKKA